ncbi:MAG: hypothetical protein K2M78_04150 [Lachnospiraceae bacterium]|nr:hypothetical protein [Lachnospiraceae bacterium]
MAKKVNEYQEFFREPFCHEWEFDAPKRIYDVWLYLPYFNTHTVEAVVKELQNSEGEDIPIVVDSESLEDIVYVPWTIHTTQHRKGDIFIPEQIGLEEFMSNNTASGQSEIEHNSQQKNLLQDIDILEQGIKDDSLFPLQQPYPQSGSFYSG